MEIEKVKQNLKNLTDEQLNRLKNSLVVFEFDDEESTSNKKKIVNLANEELNSRNP